MLNVIGFGILIFFLAVTWFKKMWILLRPINEDDPNLIDLPNNKFLRFLFNTSKSIMSNAIARMLIYFVSICVLILISLVHLVWIWFNNSWMSLEKSLNLNLYEFEQVDCKTAEETVTDCDSETVPEPKYSPCINPWVSDWVTDIFFYWCIFKLIHWIYSTGNYTKLNFSHLCQFFIRSNPFRFEINCGNVNYWILFMDHIWLIS